MTFISLADVDLSAIGFVRLIEDAAAGTVTLRFVDRDEVWTVAPDGYPTDGSVEVLVFRGRVYAAPPTGQPA